MTDSQASARAITTTCCIAGGGPAGMMLGFLLARAGVPVTVIEKHKDFLRDFRGDTIHPSTLELMAELGLLERFLARPHEKTETINVQVGGQSVLAADFTHLPVTCGYIAFMPQWEFLDFLAEEAGRFDTFTLLRSTEATDIIEQDGTVRGLRCRDADGTIEIRADLTIGADGRGSAVRDASGLQPTTLGAPMDVLWMRVPKGAEHPEGTLFRLSTGVILILIDRGTYWQIAYVIRKSGFDTLKKDGLDAFRERIVRLVPALAGEIDALSTWDDVKLLTVAVDRLDTWHCPGLLFVGDAAHAMSPVGGIGINLAIQDAVAAANLLHAPLRAGTVGSNDLAAVQKRRQWPTQITQRAQVLIQNRVIANVLAQDGQETDRPMSMPWPLRLVKAIPLLARLPARFIGMGARPEHIQSPEAGRP
jgi:2-polyprenyl-6-methoxyphenol hydroxylase-like FAD-dependent oxidoreductase